MTPASLRSRLPLLTSAITVLISSLRVATSRLPFDLAALDAALPRFSAFSGAWAQQSPCEPVAGSVQGSPFALVARQMPICGPTPTFLVLDQLHHGQPVPADNRLRTVQVQDRACRIQVEECAASFLAAAVAVHIGAPQGPL